MTRSLPWNIFVKYRASIQKGPIINLCKAYHEALLYISGPGLALSVMFTGLLHRLRQVPPQSPSLLTSVRDSSPSSAAASSPASAAASSTASTARPSPPSVPTPSPSTSVHCSATMLMKSKIAMPLVSGRSLLFIFLPFCGVVITRDYRKVF